MFRKQNSVLLYVLLQCINIAQLHAQDYQVWPEEEGGFLDQSFGVYGHVLLPEDCKPPFQVTFQQNGKPLIIGHSITNNYSSEIFMYQFLESGNLDVEFGSNGKVTLPLDGPVHGVEDCILLHDDKILIIAWTAESMTGEWNPILLKLLSDGTPDPGYGTNGMIKLEPFEDVYSTFDLKFQRMHNGNIMMGGSAVNQSENDPLFMQLDSDGNIQWNWSGNGMIFDYAYGPQTVLDYIVTEDGSIIALVSLYNAVTEVCVHKYDAEGYRDNDFTFCGLSNLANNGLQFRIYQPNPDKFLIMGGPGNSATKTLIQYDLGGNMDLDYGNEGTLEVNMGLLDMTSLLIDPLHEAYIIGQFKPDTHRAYDVTIFNLNAVGLPDNSFSQDAIFRYNPLKTLDEIYASWDIPKTAEMDQYGRIYIVTDVDLENQQFYTLDRLVLSMSPGIACKSITDVYAYHTPGTSVVEYRFRLNEPSDVFVNIADISGKIISSTRLNDLEANDHAFSFSLNESLSRGYYLVSLSNGRCNAFAKFLH